METESLIQDTGVLVSVINRFYYYVKSRDGDHWDGCLHFGDPESVLGFEEGYKSLIAQEAHNALQCEDWKESDIGSGKILHAVKAALNAERVVCKDGIGLLVDYRHHDAFDEIVADHDKEQDLWNLYRTNQDDTSFAHLSKWVGGEPDKMAYDIMAYLMFIKDDRQYLPVRSWIFSEQIFPYLHISFRMDGKCSWENYKQYISVVKDIQQVMEDTLPVRGELRLIDVHSFLWFVGESGFQEWDPDPDIQNAIEARTEKALECILHPEKKKTVTTYYQRSKDIADQAKERAHGHCELCGCEAPFMDKKGNPFLEAHHIIWLMRGGSDSVDNVAALCPQLSSQNACCG